MCFSAPVSFVAGGVLTTAGVTSISKVKKNLRYVAAIPFLFGIQQLIEWLQWLSISSGGPNILLGYLYLFFAFVLWPFYIPMVVYLNEKKEKNKQSLLPLIFLGILSSAFLLSMLILEPLKISVQNSRILYDINLYTVYLGPIIYVAVTVGSLLMSSNKYFRIFGILALASAIFTWLIYSYAFTSVWCFFAAVLSFFIYHYINIISK